MSERVLILNVDDDEAGRYAINTMLTSSGFEVIEAATGVEALALLDRKPDIVLLDVQLPDISGLEVCRRIKTDPATAGITVIHLSASRIDDADKVRGLEGGADAYLVEPIGQNELVAIMRSFVRIRRSEATQRFLAGATMIMSSTLDLDDAMDKVVTLAVPFLADWCALDHVDSRRGVRSVSCRLRASGEKQWVRAGANAERIARAQERIARLAETGKPLIGPSSELPLGSLERASDDPTARDSASEGASLSIPLIARDRVIGALTLVATDAERTFGRDDVAVAADLAARAAVSIDNATLYQEAQRAVLVRDNLLAVVSHDLKSPLNTVMMASELIADHLAESGIDPSLLRHTEVIRRAIKRMDRLICDLLDLVSIDAGHLAMEKQAVAVRSIVDDMVDFHAPLVESKGIAFEVSVAPEADASTVSCDKERIVQVLQNLLGNATKFTPKGGKVKLDVRASDGSIEWSVADSGCGIRPEHLPHLFERFWQVSKTSRQGAGLGLSIADGIVKAHGGRIWVESTLGEGSVFSFSLPRR